MDDLFLDGARGNGIGQGVKKMIVKPSKLLLNPIVAQKEHWSGYFSFCKADLYVSFARYIKCIGLFEK